MGSKNKKHLWALVSLMAYGEYCGPHFASSMFLIVIFGTKFIVDTKSILDVYCRFRVSTEDLQQLCKKNEKTLFVFPTEYSGLPVVTR